MYLHNPPFHSQFSCCDARDVLTNALLPASIWMNLTCYAWLCGSAEADKTLGTSLASANFCLLCIYGPCLRFPVIKCYISSLARWVAWHRTAFLYSLTVLCSSFFNSFAVFYGFLWPALSSLHVPSSTFYVVLFLPPDLQKLRHLILHSDEQFVLYLQEQAVIFFLWITMHYTDTVKLLAQQIFNSYLQCFRLLIAQSEMS